MGTIFRQAGRRNWMLKYYRDGRAIYESSGSEIKDDARTLLKKREGAIADGKPVTNQTGKLRFETAIKDVENDYTVNGRRSLSDLKRRIVLHLAPAFNGKRMSAITTADVRSYIATRLEAEAKPATINRELAALKRAFTLAIKAGTLGSKPHIPMLTEHNVRQGFFERDQFESIRRALPQEWQPVVTFAFWTGWRVRSEVLPLTWAQVDEEAKSVRLDPGTTKNAEGRTFPYGVLPELVAVLAAQARVRDAFKRQNKLVPWVFPDANGAALPVYYSEVWRDACRRAGTPGKIPHDLRRTAVRNLVRAGVAERTAMMLTGHKTRSVFDRYDIVNEADLSAAVERLAAAPPRARRSKHG